MFSTSKSLVSPWAVALIGLLLGALFAVVFWLGYAPAITAIFPATAVIGLVFTSLLTLLASHVKGIRHCRYYPVTLFASLALLVLSVLSMTTLVTPEFNAFIVLVFLGASAFFVSVIGLFVLMVCIVNRTERREEPDDCDGCIRF